MTVLPPLPDAPPSAETAAPTPVEFGKGLPPLATVLADAEPLVAAIEKQAATMNPHLPVIALLGLAALVVVCAAVMVMTGHGSEVPTWFSQLGFASLVGGGVATPGGVGQR